MQPAGRRLIDLDSSTQDSDALMDLSDLLLAVVVVDVLILELSFVDVHNLVKTALTLALNSCIFEDSIRRQTVGLEVTAATGRKYPSGHFCVLFNT